MKMTKQLDGRYVRLELIGETKEEVINWRDFFFNWGAIQINAHRAPDGKQDLSPTLERQEKEIDERPDGFHFGFYANKEKLIETFINSAEANTDWEAVSARGGKRARIAEHEKIKQNALNRFESLESDYHK